MLPHCTFSHPPRSRGVSDAQPLPRLPTPFLSAVLFFSFFCPPSFCLYISFVLSAFASVSCFLRLYQFRAFCVCTSFVLSAFVSVSCFLPLHQFCAFCLCISFVLSAFVSVSFSLRLHQFRSPRFQLLSRWVSKAVMSSVSCTCYIYLSTVGVFRVALVRAVKLMLLSYAFQILA